MTCVIPGVHEGGREQVCCLVTGSAQAPWPQCNARSFANVLRFESFRNMPMRTTRVMAVRRRAALDSAGYVRGWVVQRSRLRSAPSGGAGFLQL